MTCPTLNWLHSQSRRQLMLDSEVPLSMSPVSPVSVPPGFTPVSPPGSLDTLRLDLAPSGSPVVLFSSGPLLPSLVQPVLDESGEVRHTSLPSATIPAIGSSTVESPWLGTRETTPVMHSHPAPTLRPCSRTRQEAPGQPVPGYQRHGARRHPEQLRSVRQGRLIRFV